MKPNMILAVIICAIVVGMGWFTFNVVKDNISGPTTSMQINATISTGNTVYGVTGIVLIAGAICIILGMLFFWVSTPERFKKPNKFIKFLSDSLYYFGFGCIGLAIVTIPSYLIYLLFNYTVVEGNTGALIDIGKWVLIGIVAFFGIAGFGYIFKKKFVDKLSKRLEETEKEEEKEIKKISKVS